jgi:pimeloyl-ACP methyl ester carboxylesterase
MFSTTRTNAKKIITETRLASQLRRGAPGVDVTGKQNLPLIGDLHVETCGSGPPILLIHGFGASSFTWSKIIPSLIANHTIVLLDLRGFGRSRKPPDASYTLRSQAAAVLEVIDALGLVDLTVIGHSMGGGVALLVAMALEQRQLGQLNRLILIDSIACRQRLPLFIKILRLPVVGPLVLRLVPATWQVRFVLGQVYFDPKKIEQEFVDEYAAPLRCRNGRRALIATVRAIIPPDVDTLIAQYKQIRRPVFLLWGCEDRIVPVALAPRLKEAVSAASCEVLPRCGHAPQEEQPDQTLSFLRKALDFAPRDDRAGASREPRAAAPRG